MSERYTIEELEQAFQAYWHSKQRFLKIAAKFCEQQESKIEGQIIPKTDRTEVT